ncbi:hypothetical protein A3D80_01950 [Candidatus Roizmanbacteria bacterium RIFCSPHIGHO2_02_FULL_40_13b]|uniref:Uncharacterized protein n=1 Tax=Candidatus Roizmanbacteria bacterium RIFCSPHIGHO2_01_FULL_39_24 TaxID=1802032 RepID=A0A1F7GL61_9BACT|nr:MAG: hypothetical protein A2799_01310 [Candidatus Roizmanbacteria bacterium RIFCSPHIGHO2_01_FULL_39_24]OGK26891.1 MAG: hypothetical protein A3D80_01950 [Candidatus Roizmanbacteria bacterium RIFCSPHIGHO2_02_FULL_40_13b]OGK49370.1 MAG: hypothetical protein A3A56_03800 [Candidatus Roizmanbacteria bacterium RIFCSPLOWO2_01_FULL_40_32]OGK57428.1 MAG: hypothetical protein A3H83_01440 [Candidatus Roizmanbacteria bacterium RIFCSPLOWO2_02_FULL_39_8]
MNSRILNAIIIVSLVGIVGISLHDRFFPKKEVVVQAPTITQAPVVVESAKSSQDTSTAPCQSDYFNFKKGSAWKYKLLVGDVTTSTITATTSSSVTITTVFPKKEPVETVLTCRKTGVYGLPLALLPESPLQSILSTISGSVLLISTNDTLKVNSSWESPIDINLKIPFISTDGVKVVSTVEKQVGDTLTISSKLILGSIPEGLSPIKNGKVIEYQLQKNVGIKSLKFLVGESASATGSGQLNLVSFTPAR